jgi:hypothetical protein
MAISKSQKLDECLKKFRTTVLKRPVILLLIIEPELSASVILVASLFFLFNR